MLAPLDVDLGDWLRSEVQPGDTVRLEAEAEYGTEDLTLPYLQGVRIAGNHAVVNVLGGGRPFYFVGCDDVTVSDVIVDGGLPPSAGYDPEREGLHGFTIRSSSDVSLNRCVSRNVWGDGFYLGRDDKLDAPARRTTLCDVVVDRAARNGLSAVAAVDTLVWKPHLKVVGRTGMNFEAHPGQIVENWAAVGVNIDNVGLRILTATGGGDVDGLSIDVLTMPVHRSWNPTVYGIGAEAFAGVKTRPGGYGVRRNISIKHVRGGQPERLEDGIPVKVHSPPNDSVPYYQAQFICVDGLELVDVPHPADTRGSTLEEA
jgi:hypothetical protein